MIREHTLVGIFKPTETDQVIILSALAFSCDAATSSDGSEYVLTGRAA